MEHVDYICVSRDNPGVEKGVPVNWVFVCMEPSLGGWARSVEEGRATVSAGFRNFVSSIEDFILGVEQVIKTKGFVSFSRSDVRRNALGHA